MQLSLSVRIAEGFFSKEQAVLNLAEMIDLAQSAGYDAICMRASQIGVQSPPDVVEEACSLLAVRAVPVSMVTGDFDVVYNNDDGPQCLRAIEPYLQLADRFGAGLIRVALKTEDDIEWASRAAEQAAGSGIRLVHQCHTRSLFETVDEIERTLRRIGHPNFGLIFEPANLELCGQSYGLETLERLAPWIFNVYLQNQIIREDGACSLDTWCRGPVTFDLIDVHESGGIDFEQVINDLSIIGYDGTLTVHQAGGEGDSPVDSARQTASFLRERLDRHFR